MKIIDDNTKKLHWWNRNYFFAATVAVVLVNIILFATLGNDWERKFGAGNEYVFYNLLDFRNIVRSFLNSFSHANWQHVLLNMLCFFIAGIYLERKEGTLPFLFLVFVLTLFSAFAGTANDAGLNWHGFSGANYALYGYIIIDYLFMFRKRTRTKFNIISGAIVLALIYFAMCFNGGTATVGFSWYPYDLMHNSGHYTGILTGLVLGLLIHLCRFKTERELKS